MVGCAGPDMPIGDRAWRRWARSNRPLHGELEAYAEALKGAVCSLVQQGYPLRLAAYDFPQTLTPLMVSRLEFASAFSRLEREMPLSYAAIKHYELRMGAHWPTNGGWCRKLGCSLEEGREAAWRGWRAMAWWCYSNEG